MYVCLCLGVTDKDIRETIAAGASSVEEVGRCTGAGTRCGCCRATVAKILDAAETAAPSGRRLRVLSPAA